MPQLILTFLDNHCLLQAKFMFMVPQLLCFCLLSVELFVSREVLQTQSWVYGLRTVYMYHHVYMYIRIIMYSCIYVFVSGEVLQTQPWLYGLREVGSR